MAAVDSLPAGGRSGLVVESLLTFTGWMTGSFLLAMVAWVVLPALLFGWAPMVVTSGSMSPLIDKGDVVLVDGDWSQPDSGSVVAFDHGDGPIIHRVVEAHADGSLTTRGDANVDADSTRVTGADLVGTGRLLVPFIGTIRVMGAGWLLGLGALAIAGYVLWRSRPWWSATAALLAVALATLGVANAAFAATTSSEGNSFVAVDVTAPTALGAACGTIGLGNVDVDLSWTHSTTNERTGYEIFYDAPGGGTNWTSVATTGASATGYTHSLSGPLLGIGTHAYAVQTKVGPWSSPNSNSDAVSIAFVLAWVCLEV